MIKSEFENVLHLVSVSRGNKYLLQAQCAALSRRAPFLYALLVIDTWALAASFHQLAPSALTIYAPLCMTAGCLLRLAFWGRTRNKALSVEEATTVLRRSNMIAFVVPLTFVAWAMALFPYGTPQAQGHVAFFMVFSMIGTALCLVPAPTAALIAFGVAAVSFVSFFGISGDPTFQRMAVNVALSGLIFPVVIILHSLDFSSMIRAQSAALRRELQQARQLRMIDLLPVAVLTVDPVTRVINYANEASKQLFAELSHLLAVEPEDVPGATIDVFQRCPELQAQLMAHPSALPHRARVQLGPEVLDVHVSALCEPDGAFIGSMLTWSLVTEEVEAASRMHQLAHFDVLTGLSNRASFYEMLNSHLASESATSAVMLVDLDGFKLINDTHGHRAGDEVLRQVASRLRTACAHNRASIGRLGGDEFAVLIRGCGSDEAAAFAGDLLEALAEPYPLDGHAKARSGASIGVALTPMHGRTGSQALAHADMALYAAKDAGKSAFRIFSPQMEASLLDRRRLEAQLRAALDAPDELFVFYQPIVNIETRRATAYEALIRWHHPDRGWIAPCDFIRIAEQSDLIGRLGSHVLLRACTDAAEWDQSIRVSVNLSAVQLGRGTLVQDVLSALAVSGLSPHRLELEITETAFLKDEAATLGDLRRLRGLGVGIALDDFGTGYSSLAHLRMFAFDKIKIDRSFVADAVERPDCAIVVGAVAALAQRLGATSVAEGVETEAQLACVRSEGCQEAQGYLFGRPMPHTRDADLVDKLNRMHNFGILEIQS